MATLRGCLNRAGGGALLVVALVLAFALYAPTLGRGLVNYDDPWLVADNWIVQDASWESVRTIFFDLHSPRRWTLSPEYLPVRDLSMMVDFAVWGHWYGGFHLTNLLLYLGCIIAWFFALRAFGVDDKLAGVAILLWALHPSHAESVAWITERKGLLGMLFGGVCALAYARYRSGDRLRWLVLAAFAAVAAVWGKAIAAFAVAALGALELTLPARRVSWRRSMVGLAVIGGITALAYIPVLFLALDASVVGTQVVWPMGRVGTVFGTHGHYVLGSLMVHKNTVAYPTASIAAPHVIAIGAAALVAACTIVAIPVSARWRRSPELRVGAAVWLVGWLPVSHVILPLQMVLVADRYLLLPTLGAALAAAAGLRWLAARRRELAIGLGCAVCLAAALRTLDAQSNWRDALTLWERATATNPTDGGAWSLYSEALAQAGQRQRAKEVVEEGLRHTQAPRLVMRHALFLLDYDRAAGIAKMREAAEGGEYRAMANLATLLLEDGKHDEALPWAKRAVKLAPAYVHGQRTLGRVTLALGRHDEAFAAFNLAFALEPQNAMNRYNLALALVALARTREARIHLEQVVNDPAVGGLARAMLAQLDR